MKALHTISFILVIVGALNWLVVGLFSRGLADLIGGSVSRVVYVLVGLGAIYLIATHKKDCKCCDKSMSTGGSM